MVSVKFLLIYLVYGKCFVLVNLSNSPLIHSSSSTATHVKTMAWMQQQEQQVQSKNLKNSTLPSMY